MNSVTEEKMLIIGAGPTGLAMARQLRLAGVSFDHVEADSRIGGVWAHGVHGGIELVSSRKITGFPEFPMARQGAVYPTQGEMLDYLNRYADHFDLRAGIALETRVVYVGPAAEQRWNVMLEGGEHRVYKGVFVCNGHHWDPRWPAIPGDFSGRLMHSKEFRNPDEFAGKRVLVMGGGNSGCDMATNAAGAGACAHWSLRRGYWIMPKTIFGIPAVEYVNPWMSVAAQRLMLRFLLRLRVGPYARYGLLEPDHDVFERHPTISSTVLPLLRAGRLTPRPDVARFDGETVHFTDGSASDFDVVVCATGYHVSVPFLAPGLFETRGPVAQLYGGALVDGYRHLYIMATAQVRSGVGAVVGPYVEHIRMLMDVQESLSLPLSTVLKSLGERPPSTHLFDPHIAIRKMKAARERLPAMAAAQAEKLGPAIAVEDLHRPQPIPDAWAWRRYQDGSGSSSGSSTREAELMQ